MELLKDPLNDRQVNSFLPPPCRPLTLTELLQGTKNLPSYSKLKKHLSKEGQVTKQAALHIISTAGQLLKQEPTILTLSDPVTIVGDIHGQFYDFLKILEIGGRPKHTRYLFLGDFVDRGIFSIEVLLLLYTIKINYSQNVFLLRGNHESRHMTSFFNFRSEVLHKFDLEVYEAIMNSFDCLPLVCIVNESFLAVHGGLSPELHNLKDLEKINRFTEPPREGLFCDLLWSDPVDSTNGNLPERFKYNTARSCSHYFGSQAANKFLNATGLISIIRAHEAQLDGYKMHRWSGQNEFPVVITLFSAPNYCDCYNNKGAILKLEDNTLNLQQYSANIHPYHLPNFLDVFRWSVPFVIEKILELMNSILKPGTEIKVKGELVERMKEEMKENRKLEIKNKIKMAVGMMKAFKSIEEEEGTEFLKVFGNGRASRELSVAGRDALVTALEQFYKVKKGDCENEGMPVN